MTNKNAYSNPAGDSLPSREEEILEFWKENQIFEKSVTGREGRDFVFYEGPPTANARPGIHHASARAVKDLVCRYWTMRGYRVIRKGGWDTHGLPVELEVEKELELKSKGEIEKYGIEPFNEKCRARVFKFTEEWQRMSDRIGYWVDMHDPYITCKNEYIESVWSVLKSFWDAGLMYQGHKVIPYCPRCGTPLSSHEVAQGYKDVTDPSVFVKFRHSTEANKSFLVWTTTPWTLPSNAAIAIAANQMYVEAIVGDERLVLAEARLEEIFGEDQPEVAARYLGEELVGESYERLYPFAPEHPKAWKVIAGDFVSLDDGTGIVHIAPAFGEDDNRVGRTEGLPAIRPVDGTGCFTAEVTPWAGRFVKDCDPEIIDELDSRGLLFRKQDVTHSYPHCWRCQSPLLYYARESWFIETTKIRDAMIEQVSKISWYPSDVGANRIGRWLENNVDWALSRDRYWGTPLNVWVCDGCGSKECIGTIDQLQKKAGDLPADLDLHRPWIDNICWKCGDCGGAMNRVAEVIDVWFDSGCMPYAQWHWPADEEGMFDSQFPANFIAEGIDQTRGWFYSLLAISTHLSGQSSYKSCFTLNLILDEDGKKMSKTRGNAVDPWMVLEEHGADALRWYLFWASPLWLPRRFSMDALKDVGYRFLDTLRNTHSFFSLYANIDEFRPDPVERAIDGRTDLDRWILSRLHSTIKDVRESFERYDLNRAARDIQELVLDDLSNWYVRRSRRRFWRSEMDGEKRAAFETLWDVLIEVAKLSAPFVPFAAEDLWRGLVLPVSPDSAESVHLTDYPEADETLIDGDLEAGMAVAREATTLGRAVRTRMSLKTRQPVRRIVITVPDERVRESVRQLTGVIRDELNAREIDLVESGEEWIGFTAKPLFPEFGPVFGKKAKAVGAAIRELPSDLLAAIRASGRATVEIDGEETVLEASYMEIEEKAVAPWEMERGVRTAVFVDIELDDDLLEEGLARELINKIQFMRKDSGFDVVDRIQVTWQGSERLKNAIDRFSDTIKADTLTVEIDKGEPAGDGAKEWDLNGEAAVISIARVTGEKV